MLETLAQEFREHARARKGGSQVFITTHQPYFVDALEPLEVQQADKHFSPRVIAVQTGTMVRGSNKDNILHHVYNTRPLGDVTVKGRTGATPIFALSRTPPE